jgi:hypothetical protein
VNTYDRGLVEYWREGVVVSAHWHDGVHGAGGYTDAGMRTGGEHGREGKGLGMRADGRL